MSSWGRILALKKYQPKYSSHSPLEEEFLAQVKYWELPEPTREFFFHPTRKWRADFAWKEAKILVEIQGGLYGKHKGNHVTRVEADYEKINVAQVLGYRVFQFGHKALNRGPKRHPDGMSDAIQLLRPLLCHE